MEERKGYKKVPTGTGRGHFKWVPEVPTPPAAEPGQAPEEPTSVISWGRVVQTEEIPPEAPISKAQPKGDRR